MGAEEFGYAANRIRNIPPTSGQKRDSLNCTHSFILLNCIVDCSFKQTTYQDCDIERLDGSDSKGQRKWDVWNSDRGMLILKGRLIVGVSEIVAREQYVLLAKDLWAQGGVTF